MQSVPADVPGEPPPLYVASTGKRFVNYVVDLVGRIIVAAMVSALLVCVDPQTRFDRFPDSASLLARLSVFIDYLSTFVVLVARRIISFRKLSGEGLLASS